MLFISKKKETRQMYSNNKFKPVTDVLVFNSFSSFNKNNINKKTNITLYQKFNKQKNVNRVKNNICIKQNLYFLKFFQGDMSITGILDLIKNNKIAWYEFFYYNSLSIELLKKKFLFSLKSKTIGKGFAGTIKRYGFKRGPMSHGSKNHRLIGSIGASTTPGRVFKGKKMAGRLGNKNVTFKKVIKVEGNGNTFSFLGTLPGKNGNLVYLNC